MKLLLDENISYRIVKKIGNHVEDCLHINRSGLKMPATDIEIWEYAKQNDYMIITFDEDFEDISSLYGFPPKVILLRLGNSSTQILADTLLLKISEIEQFNQSKLYGILEIF